VAFTIAVTGKGGVGKTTVSGLLVLRLIARACRPVLVVDADPNTCLDGALGISAPQTIGRVREEAREIASKGLSSGVSKQRLLDLKIAESLVEGESYDFLAMGRCEGPGCYCYANNVLKEALGKLTENYRYVVVDNEAGLENLSRRLVPRVDLLVLVTEPTPRGFTTARRLHALAAEMGIAYTRSALVVNRLRRREWPHEAEELRTATGAQFALGLPADDGLADLSERGDPLTTLPAENTVVAKIDAFLDEVLTAERSTHG
jgi:CO dehydrogenase maturation factor